uniref:Uncharacterized protein n=1 Tax=Anguilla anguilla TaxID=7936 RepID=A0A0E9TG87_ANGAN
MSTSGVHTAQQPVKNSVIGALREGGQPSQSDRTGDCIDERAHAQKEDVEIQQIVELKRGQQGQQVEVPSNPALQKYAPVWAQ